MLYRRGFPVILSETCCFEAKAAETFIDQDDFFAFAILAVLEPNEDILNSNCLGLLSLGLSLFMQISTTSRPNNAFTESSC